MSFGQIIKKLRRDADFTQEQLAEMLSISPQAVSRWETDVAMPDISLLPILANIFDVSSDYLLEIDIENKEKKIQKICEKAMMLVEDGYTDEATALLREGLYTYPNSYKLMIRLADNLFVKGRSDEALELAMKVIDKCTDISVKTEAIRCASDILFCQGKKENAINLAKTLPEITSDFLLCKFYEGAELVKHYKKTLLDEITLGLYHMQMMAGCTGDKGKGEFNPIERACIYTKILKIYDILFEDGDYHYFAQFPAIASRELAKIHVDEGRVEEALEYVRQYIKYGTMFAEYPRNSEFTSMLFRGICYGGRVKSHPDSNYFDEMYRELSADAFSLLKDNDEFKTILEGLVFNSAN